ncbi:MAG: hypothetical protein J3Q66DRAFT_35707 [Benniella sp.]|nr:MAG: hypothetical protein J3Q66DRAFT_35707 [Benniella sp.]
MIVGNDDDGPMYLEPSDDEEELLAMEDYVQNTKDMASLEQLESLIGALTGLGSVDYGYSKDLGDVACDDSDLDDQLSEGDIQDDLGDLDDIEDDLDDLDEDDEDDFDFEDDYEDSIRKMDFGKVVTSMNDTRKNRKADDLLREELRDLMPLWRSGALQDGDGANRRFKSKSRAKGYDLYDPDDGFMIPSSATRKKNKEPHGGSFQTLVNLNSQIEDFVKDRNKDVLDLPPMPKPLRRKVHLLCNHYCLSSQSHGTGKNRYPVLIKTDRTKMPVNPVNLHKLANQPERELKELTKLSAQFQGSRKGNGGGGGKGMGKGRGGKSGGGISAAVHGTVVGASASEISSENVGHRMLSKMGWTPGDGLGATGDGIKQPIEAGE